MIRQISRQPVFCENVFIHVNSDEFFIFSFCQILWIDWLHGFDAVRYVTVCRWYGCDTWPANRYSECTVALD